MKHYKRFALYFLPQGALHRFGAGWFGWDVITGTDINQNDRMLPLSLQQFVEKPRKYGLHATIKAPFRLKSLKDYEALIATTQQIAKRHGAFTLSLSMTKLGRFLALTCTEGDPKPLKDLAADCVQSLDVFRAPLTEDELNKRLAAHLKENEKSNVMTWGYPYVFESYRFHITLTDKVSAKNREALEPYLETNLAPCIYGAVTVNAISLVGEREDGQFESIRAFPLSNLK